jgi:hypothetical protein
MNVKKNIIIILFLFLLVSPAYADKIFLKSGNFVEGEIIEDGPTGVLLAIKQENKGSSASKVSRDQISSLEIDAQEPKTPVTSLESKEKVFKKNILTFDSTVFFDSKYDFYIEVYPAYYFSRRDAVRDEVLFSSSKGEALLIEIFPCNDREKNLLLSSYGSAIAVTPGMNKKVRWQGMDVYRKNSQEYHKKVKMTRSAYLLFPESRADFGVSLIFIYPESLGAEKGRQNMNIVNTACVKPGAVFDFWARLKNVFIKGK